MGMPKTSRAEIVYHSAANRCPKKQIGNFCCRTQWPIPRFIAGAFVRKTLDKLITLQQVEKTALSLCTFDRKLTVYCQIGKKTMGTTAF
jgi:hypothetical protein